MIALVEKFYSSFENMDVESMVECYHHDITFSDPAFGTLKGNRASNMWRMLIKSQEGKKFVVTYSDIKSSGKVGSAHWEAQYNFSKTGRFVHNKINAAFEFKDGKIYTHTDDFNLHVWSRQALGITGYLLGWSSGFKKKLQKQTNAMLDRFEELNS